MTEPNSTAPATDEQIRKIYVKDLKAGETIHTVFKAAGKELHTSRQGKPWLSVTLHDKTGAVDARVFENVDAASQAFTAGDYLLLQGRVGTFHGKSQVVIDRLERLDPGPIDASEFHFVPPPAPSAPPREPRKDKEKAHEDKEHGGEADSLSHKAARQRLLKLLDNPQLTQALDLVLRSLDRYIDDRIALKLSQGAGGPKPEPKADRKPKGPRVEHRAATEPKHEHRGDHKPEPKRDPTLPEGLAFKPLTELLPKSDEPKASTEPQQG